MDTAVDVVVVGGGLAGLTAAVTAAQRGARVEVLEARADIGGRARTTESNGFLCNEGPHALYRGAGGIEVLRKLGVHPDGGIPPTTAVGLDGGRLGVLPSGPASLLRTPFLGNKGKFQIARLLASVSRIDTATLANVTVTEWIESEASDPAARRLLHSLVRLTTFVNAPEALSAKVAVEQLKSGLSHGVLYLHGGWQTLVDALAAQAFDAGVSVRSGVKVENLDPGDASVRVDSSDGSIDAAAVIVAAGGPNIAAKLIDDEALRSFAATSRPAFGAVLDVGLSEPWGDHPGFVLGLDQPVYMSVHSNTARVHRDGTSLVSVHKYLVSDAGASDADRAELEGVLDLARPGWREVAEHVTFSRRLVPMTHIPSAASGGIGGRPGASSAQPRTFVAGDWVGDRGLLADAAIVSAHRAGSMAAAALEANRAPSAA